MGCENMKIKKRWIFIIILIVFLGIYCSYKGICLYFYDMNRYTSNEYNKYIKDLKFGEKVTINKKNDKIEEYLKYKNISIRNDFKDFQKMNNKDNYYILYDEKGNIKASFSFGITKSATSIFKQITNKTLGNIKLFYVDLYRVLKDNNIKNDLDLIKKALDRKNSKNTFFTSIKTMKENYAFQHFCSVQIPAGVIHIIEGIYTGYMIKGEKATHVYLLKDEKVYYFNFMHNEYFKKHHIIDLVSTIIIE